MRHLQSRYGVIASSVVVAPFLTYTWPKGIGPVRWEATPVAAAAAVAAAASAAAPLASAALERIRSNEIISRGACGARVGEDTRDSWRGEVGRETPAHTHFSHGGTRSTCRTPRAHLPCHKGAGGVRDACSTSTPPVERVYPTPRAPRAPCEECNRLSHVSTPPRAPRAPGEGV